MQKKALTSFPERFPLACQWEITCRCNLRCVMCYTDCYNHPQYIQKELSTHEIIRIMDELKAEGCLELTLTGGEPMARPDFFEIYEHAKTSGFLITIFTNGTLMTQDAADRFARLPPHRVEISLHGLTELTFEGITQGKGSYRRCMKAIHLLLERRIPLTLKTTAMSANKDEILEIKRYVQGLGHVEYKLGEEMRPALDGSDEPRRLGLTGEELLELNHQDPELWNEACRNRSKESAPCRSGMQRFHIDAYGRLQLCSGNRRQSFDLRQGSFRDGFYRAMPAFPCPFKPGTDAVQSELPVPSQHV